MRVPKPLGSYPFYLQPFFWNQRRNYGEVLQAALLWARVPKLFAAVAVLYAPDLPKEQAEFESRSQVFAATGFFSFHPRMKTGNQSVVS
jgi:hypothetical protein